MKRVLLGQLGSNGDCLYATTIARQIKADFPGCHLTWAISSLCRGVIENNPDVDAIWEVPLRSWAWLTADYLSWLQASFGLGPDRRLNRSERELEEAVAL